MSVKARLTGSFLVLFVCLFHVIWSEEAAPDITLSIPMRDGVELPTYLFLPDPQARGLPCILVRSPGGLAAAREDILSLAKEGYVVAIQSTRSALDVEGKTMPYLSDGWGQQQDGYDTVEWLAKSHYTNGVVGTMGASALGITQLLLAPTAPPSLKCQYVKVAAASLYHHAIFPGGEFRKDQVEGWLSRYAKDPSVLAHVKGQPRFNDFWKQFDSVQVAEKVQVPAIHYGGWYDMFIQGTIDGFFSRQEFGGKGARGAQKLVIGPWIHAWPLLGLKLGDFEVPEAGRSVPIDISAKSWFEFHLKGIDNGTGEIPSVIYYVMGPFDGAPSGGNVWKMTNIWPVPSVPISFYLSADGKLVADKGEVKESTLSYRHDSEKPIPTIGGRNLFLESGPKDQSSVEGRDDILVFTTDPLGEELEVTGRMTVKVDFASDQEAMDVAVRLTDVYPDGRSILIADGLGRFTPAKGHSSREVEVDLWSTSIVFAKGHSIRVSVSSANYPCFENCKSSPSVAVNTVKVGGAHATSRLILPVVR